jgi:hypothetical protein
MKNKEKTDVKKREVTRREKRKEDKRGEGTGRQSKSISLQLIIQIKCGKLNVVFISCTMHALNCVSAALHVNEVEGRR